MSSESWEQLKYHKIQQELWKCSKKWVYVPAGRQSGKTLLALRRIVRYLPIKKPWSDPRYFYCSPTLNQARRIAWGKLKKLIPSHWVSSVSESTLTIRTIFGSEVFLFSMEKPSRIEGIQTDGGVVDECSDIKVGSFDLSILPTMAHRGEGCWTWFIGVPKRYGCGCVEFRDKYFQAARGELPNSAAFTWPSSGIVSKEYLETARARMDERDYREQFEASFESAAGGIFHSWDAEYNVRPVAYDPTKTILLSCDFNVDPMVWVLGHCNGTTLEVFDEIFKRNTYTQECIDLLVSKYKEHKGGWELYGDASARARKTSATTSDLVQLTNNPELKKMGRTMHYIKSNPLIGDRFAATNALICSGDGQRRLFVDESCKNLINDLRSRSYKPGTRDVADVGDQGHATDALGYLIYKKWAIKIEIPISNKVIIRR